MKTNYSKENLEKIVKESYSLSDVIRALGLVPKGSNFSNIKKYIEKYKINTDHFTGSAWNKNKKVPIVSLNDILNKETNFSSNRLLNRLVQEGIKEYKCECCGISNWQNKNLVLQLHHIDGDHYNNELSNLQILCPNCHSQTKTFCNRKTTITNRKTKPESIYKTLNPEKVCPICNKQFKPQRKTQIYCCRACYNKDKHFSTPLTKETLIKETENCSTLTELGKKFNLSRVTLRKYLKEFNLLDDFKSKYNFHAIPILQCDIEGNIIKEWPSITDAEQSLSTYNIRKCLSHKCRSAGGYLWKYKNEK